MTVKFNYSQSENPQFEAILAMRTAAKEGAFFLPHLKNGMRVLDVGCGPGSITLGIAEVLGSGEVVGVDLQPAQVAKAKELSTTKNIKNAHFEVADANELPFPDGSFDAVFANSVLGHLPQPLQGLSEMRRVLRTGGIIGIRDLDWGGRILSPTTPLLEEWFEVTIKVRKFNGGNPHIGRNHRRLLLDSGFLNSKATVSVWSLGTEDEVKICGTFLKAQLQGFSRVALSNGWLDQKTLEAVCADIDNWSSLPESFYMDTYCEAIAYKE